MLPELVAALDGRFAFLPPLSRIVLWGAFSSFASMGLYALFSPQLRMKAIKSRQQSARRALLSHQGGMEEMLRLIRADLSLSFKHLACTLPPVLLASLPLILLSVCLSFIYDYRLPAPGEPVSITLEPSAPTHWQPESGASPIPEGWSIPWPSVPATLLDEQGNTLLRLPSACAMPEITTPDWTDAIFPNPAGSVPENSTVKRIRLDLKPAEYIHFGPPWMRGFLFWYFTAVFLASLALKRLWRLA